LNAEYYLRVAPWKYLVRLIPGLRNYLNIIVQVNTTGIPQGIATGPLLSALYLAPYLKDFKPNQMISYLDDGLIFGDQELVNKFTNIIENLELKIADNKSG
jgi:hypothetical protein